MWGENFMKRGKPPRAGKHLRWAIIASQSQPIIRWLERVLRKLKTTGRQLPQSPLVSAIDYTLGPWQTFWFIWRMPGWN